MSYAVSLEDYTPGQRYDEIPWTEARIEQAAVREGPFTAIETIVFDDPDEDPTAPKTRSFTTDQATIAAGWFRVVFLDAAAVEQPASPVYFPHPGARPSLEDVAAVLWARTKDEVGESGTFTEDTRPTAAQVTNLIDQGIADVAMRSGTIPEGLEDVAREAATLKVAATIERSYFPEQANQENSAYSLFREEFLELVTRLIEATFDPAGGAKGVVTVPLTTTVASPPELLT